MAMSQSEILEIGAGPRLRVSALQVPSFMGIYFAIVDPPLYELIEEIAERQGVSMSLVTRDLIKEALEMEEDIALGRPAAEW